MAGRPPGTHRDRVKRGDGFGDPEDRARRNSSRIHVVIVDADAHFIRALAYFLETEPRLEVVGRASSVEEVVGLTEETHPDLVLVDLATPGPDGLEATRRLKALVGPPRVVVLTTQDGPEFRSAARAAGADAVVEKAVLGETLLVVIEALFRDENRGRDPRQGRV